MSRAQQILAIVLAGSSICLCAQTRPTPTRRAGPSAQSQAPDPLDEAEKMLQNGQYAGAEENLRGLVKTRPKNPQAWFDLGFAQSHLGMPAEAAESYQKAVDLAPDWFEANLNLGVALAKAGKRPEAISALKHAVELRPSEPTSGSPGTPVKPSADGQQAIARAWLTLADTMADEGSDLKAAAAAYDKAAELGLSADSSIAVRAGALLEKAGDSAGAEAHYRKAAESGDSAGMAKLIDLLRSEKRDADAETWLRKYVAQNPQDARASIQLARLLVAEGKKDEASALLKPMTGSAGWQANQELGELYLDNKQYAEATPLLQQAVAANPREAQLHYDLGVALLHQLKYADAEAELLKAVQLKPDLTDAYSLLADAAFQNKHYELCLRALDFRARSLPETPATYFLRATAYDSLHMYKPAVANYKQFLAVAGGKFPDQEFQARHRIKAIEPQ